MPEYKEIEKTVEVPPGTRIDGYLETLRSILKKSRVQQIILRTNGKVSYRRYVSEDEPEEELQIDFSTLMPYHIIRNGLLQEIPTNGTSGGVAIISRLFGAAREDGLKPIAWVANPESIFWQWHGAATGVVMGKDDAYGLPMHVDADIPKDVLILCAAFSRDARLIDTRKSYKVHIPLPAKRTP